MTMRALRRLVVAFASLITLAVVAAMVVGVPVMLVVGFGWPLPRHLPSWDEITMWAQTGGMDIGVVLTILACLLWVVWLYFITGLVLETSAKLRGANVRPARWAVPGQRVGAAVIGLALLSLNLLARPAAVRQPSPLSHMLSPSASSSAPHRPEPAAQLTAHIAPLSAPSAAESSGSLPAASSATERVEVVAGDTLWGIAGTAYDKPTEWPRIWEANRGHREADGRTFDNPHWIHPGWQLEVPGVTTAAAPARAATPPHPLSPATPPAVPVTPPASAAATAAPSVPASSAALPRTATPASTPGLSAPMSDGRAHVGDSSLTVALERGGIIAGATAAAILGLLLAAQRRERWRTPSSDRSPSRVALLARRRGMLRLRGALAAESHPSGDDGGQPRRTGGPELQADLATTEAVPGRILVGLSGDGRATPADIDQLHGLSLRGPGGEPTARAMLLAFLAHHPWEMAQAVVGGPSGHSLLPAGAGAIGSTLLPDVSAFLDRIESEIRYHRARLEANHLEDWRRLLDLDRLPALLALVRAEDLIPAHLDRLGAVISDSKGCAIALIVVGALEPAPAWIRPITVDADGTIDPAGAPLLGGAQRLYHVVDDEEMAEFLLAVVRGRGPDLAPEISEDEEATLPQHATSRPTPLPSQRGNGSRPFPSFEPRLVDISIFGRFRVVVRGREIGNGDGLIDAGREVLALLVTRECLTGRGVTKEEGISALGAGNPARFYANRWNDGLYKTRALFRRLLGDEGGDCIATDGPLFRLNSEVVSSDYGRVLAGRDASSHVDDPEMRRLILAGATRELRGEPFAGVAWNWLIEDQENVRRDGMTTLQELADLYAQQGDLVGAVDTLEQALTLDVDPVEDVFCRLMVLHHRLGDGNAVNDLYQRLQHQLSVRCDASPSPETYDLMQSLRVTAPAPRAR